MNPSNSISKFIKHATILNNCKPQSHDMEYDTISYYGGNVRYTFNPQRCQIYFYFCDNDNSLKLVGIKSKKTMFQDHYYCCENFQSKSWPNVKIEKFLYRIFLNLHLQINNMISLLITKHNLNQLTLSFIGHGFGGALSTVMSLYYLRAHKRNLFNVDLVVKNITYGAYKAGNLDFVDMYESYFSYYPDCKNYHLDQIKDFHTNYPLNDFIQPFNRYYLWNNKITNRLDPGILRSIGATKTWNTIKYTFGSKDMCCDIASYIAALNSIKN
jgi:hypothetical protein